MRPTRAAPVWTRDAPSRTRAARRSLAALIYGVELRHYETVGAALIWTLEQGLGEAFTPAVREAWLAAYHLLAKTMQAGASARAAA